MDLFNTFIGRFKSKFKDKIIFAKKNEKKSLKCGIFIDLFLDGISLNDFIRSAGFIAACMPCKESGKYTGQTKKAK